MAGWAQLKGANASYWRPDARTGSSLEHIGNIGSTEPIAVLRGRNRVWADLEEGGLSTDAVNQSGIERKELQGDLLRALTSDSLVVLTGLGTSLGIPEIEDRKAPTMADLWTKVSEIPNFTLAMSAVPASLIEARNVEHLLSHVQARISIGGQVDELRTFLSTAQSLILEKCSFVDEATPLDMHQMFLRKIGRRSARLQRTRLFTTNYDLAFEESAARSRFHLIDGFGHAAHREFDGTSFDLDFVRRGPNDRLVLEGNVLHLLKLHGSVDWERSGAGARRIQGHPAEPVLIYPSANKYQLSFRQPYLEMMSRFQMALRSPDVAIIIVGFGFNDEHIVAPIEAAVRSNVGLRVIVVDPGIRNSWRSKSLEWLEKLAIDGDHRITLVKGTFDDLVRLLPDAAEYDERQSHAERISRVDEGGM